VTATRVDVGDGLPLTLPALLAARAVDRPDHRWVVCDDDALTYREADTASAALAKGLLAAGVGRGTHVGLLHPNGSEFVVRWLAAARIGAVAVPFATLSTAPELRALLDGADVEVMLAARGYRNRDYTATLAAALDIADLSAQPLQLPAVPALRRVVFETDYLVAAGTAIDDATLAAAEAEVTPADRLVIVHTSGSTSAPKGVIHQHGPLIRHLDNLNELREYAPDDVLFANSAFFWIAGFAYGLIGTLLAGATLLCSNATDPSDTLDLLERERPTMVNGFAAAVAHLAEHPSFSSRDLSSIRRGNLWPILPPDIRPADPGLRHNMFGMSETGSVCLACPDETDQPEHRRGSCGRPVPGLDAKVVDPETGVERATGEVGELWFRGPFLMEGYYGRERHDTFTPDGWFRTGDLFHVDDEGFFYFVGRRGDMIKTAGANVSPREVEAAIAAETGLTAHVVGLDDAERGQIVAAAIRVPAGQASPDLDQLRVALRGRLSAYKVPRRFLALADLDVPMLSSGKLDTSALEALFDA
jgi:acyl-CoA synthetase (AMP-forming)/AMP-acid ligase II